MCHQDYREGRDRKVMSTCLLTRTFQVDIDKLIMHATDTDSELQLTRICGSWKASYWEELDWSRIKLLSIRDTLEARKVDLQRAAGAQCLSCPDFVKHVRPERPSVFEKSC